MFVTEAFAMGAPQGAGAPTGQDMLMQFFPLILMFVIFYFLLIRPQKKRANEHKAMLAALKKGDYIITTAGLLGRVVELSEEVVEIECGTAQLRLSRSAIGGLVDKDGKPIAPAAK